ncbi:MAG: EamA/RhaT family transporter [Crocinitomicaceae bacterium]|nr:EamA/RhaT family transporter [Crocinitomicaceae bacterium]
MIFKLFQRYSIDTFQAIVFNYFTALIIGFSLYGNTWKSSYGTELNWLPYAFCCSILFIGLFFVMGKSSQLNGVASTSIAVKMSMAISLLLMILIYNEAINILKIIGIALAFLGVYLVTARSKNSNNKGNSLWMLGLLFLGSGTLDFGLSYIQNANLSISLALFSAVGFGLAGFIGLVILIINIILGKAKILGKNILAGIILGIPNYFSIYLLLLSYQTTGWNDSTVLAITNVSIVLCSAIIGFVAFKENSSTKKIIGLVASILAIVILFFSQNIL